MQQISKIFRISKIVKISFINLTSDIEIEFKEIKATNVRKN